MTATHEGRSAAIRARVNHPIIDSDGHQVEMGPIFLDYLKAEAGPKVAERFPVISLDGYTDAGWWTLSPQSDLIRSAAAGSGNTTVGRDRISMSPWLAH